jgi:thiamine pyrophosphate-dependent acetolactate synthase large subunit-like protein
MIQLENVELPEIGNPAIEWSSDVMAEMLRRLGLKYLAMNPGASYRGLHDSIVNYLGNRDPQMLLCLNEGAAVAIAHGYGKVTEEPMGCLLHSNVGLMNGLMQIYNAWCARVPIVLVGAGGPIDADQRRPWVDWIHTSADQGAMLRNFTKWDNSPASAPAAVEALLRANQIARTAPKGPTYVCLDAGLQETPAPESVTVPDLARFQPGPSPYPAPSAVEDIAARLTKAKRPLLFIGKMSRQTEDWNRRVRLAEALGARVVTDLRAGACFPTEHPLHGPAPRPNLAPDSQALMRQADVILALECVDLAGALKLVASGGPTAAHIIHCSVDSYSHNGWSMDHQGLAAVDLRVLADPDALVEMLLAAVVGKSQSRKEKWQGVAPADHAIPAAPELGNEAITYRHIAYCLQQARGNRKITIVRTGLGWASEHYPFHDPLDYLGWDGGGGLGAGPGMAIGAGLALRGSGRVPMTIVGDGDFLQGATSLWTAAHYRIPCLILVANNSSNFNDEIHQELVAKERHRPTENKWIGMRIDDPAVNLGQLARSQGVDAGGPVRKAGDLTQALETAIRAVEEGRPYLLDVVITPTGGPLLKRA